MISSPKALNKRNRNNKWKDKDLIKFPKKEYESDLEQINFGPYYYASCLSCNKIFTSQYMPCINDKNPNCKGKHYINLAGSYNVCNKCASPVIESSGWICDTQYCKDILFMKLNK